MDLQLFNAVSRVSLRGLVISEINFEIGHKIAKKINAFILGGPPIGSAQSEHLVNYGILNYHMRCHDDVA